LDTETVSMFAYIEVGMVMTSHVPGALSEASFDNVVVHSDTAASSSPFSQ
jgi:hypothetical protein